MTYLNVLRFTCGTSFFFDGCCKCEARRAKRHALDVKEGCVLIHLNQVSNFNVCSKENTSMASRWFLHDTIWITIIWSFYYNETLLFFWQEINHTQGCSKNMLYTEVINWTCKIPKCSVLQLIGQFSYGIQVSKILLTMVSFDSSTDSLIMSVCEKLFQTYLNKSLS